MRGGIIVVDCGAGSSALHGQPVFHRVWLLVQKGSPHQQAFSKEAHFLVPGLGQIYT